MKKREKRIKTDSLSGDNEVIFLRFLKQAATPPVTDPCRWRQTDLCLAQGSSNANLLA